MDLFGNTRLKIGNSILSKKIGRTRRKPSYTSIHNVRSIGIVWDASKTSEFASLSRFFQKMHDRKIDVRILGYFPGKELPDQYTAIRFLTCLRKTEVGFFYIPDSAETEYFINNKFDILIDINFDRSLPLRYITALSAASFKVGLYDKDSGASGFDLMMEMKKNAPIESYLDEIMKYLEMINSGSPVHSKN